jgi:glyoxylase-like metal-dependent hydrolase (beta-lactamase superfamily II)
MLEAAELQQVTRSIWLWQAYDPAIKSDLFSSALLTQIGLFLIDPIRLAPSAFAELTAGRRARAILTTNSNHLRHSAVLAQQEQIPISAAKAVTRQPGEVEMRALRDREEIVPALRAIAIEGAAEGEMAFHFADEGGTLVVGDALINVEPNGFSLLPAKYCANQKQMRRSLRSLLDFAFERLLFAHGQPLVSAARTRLETLLR